MAGPRTSLAPPGADPAPQPAPRATTPPWRSLVAGFERPDVRRSVAQVVTTLALLFAGVYLTYRSLALPYVVTLLCAMVAGAFLVRTFMLMHDCAHGSLFPSRRANETLGAVTGVLTLTPFVQWRRDHVLHHASAGDLDRRGHGDVRTLTVREYVALSRAQRLRYRIYRHPLVLLGLGPLHLAVGQRYRPRSLATGDKERASVRNTNLALLALVVGWSFVVGLKAVLLVYVPVFYFAGMAGIWLFFVQHQFEGTHWTRHDAWNYAAAAIEGSSYLRLPRVLEWLTCSIGLHHVHHLSPRVPNYRLRPCLDAHPELLGATRVTARDTMRAFSLKLWDEDAGRLVGFAAARPFDIAASAPATPRSESR
jgi:acyl-lipid omega-6 desaturase (Delta-12 desaturase)